jgi:D-serine dehydratase
MLDRNALISKLAGAEPWLWLNPDLRTDADATAALPLGIEDMHLAEQRLQRFATLLVRLFPELHAANGIIESQLLAAPAMQTCLNKKPGASFEGRLWIKADHQLPVAGSIKARGGIYEVLHFAEALALKENLICEGDDYSALASPKARRVFECYTLSVGSTGNLGLSIGLIAAALGFKACVHMSVEAKQWKKDRLRKNGVSVIEHSDDYSRAVAAGRETAASDEFAYFVDDEQSPHLFLGYSVAALRLQQQLADAGVTVDTEHPLFVYLPCGVGGAPGGITFGLKQVFGPHVHCFFAEPVQAPSMLLGMATDFADNLSVYDAGLTIDTEADGLAVGQASAFVGQMMKPLLSGIFTVKDEQLFKDLYHLKQTEGLSVEPSAAAGVCGPGIISNSQAGLDYLGEHQLTGVMANANHVLWSTGGIFVPEAEYQTFWQRGEVESGQ